jgi:hypothetical protein
MQATALAPARWRWAPFSPELNPDEHLNCDLKSMVQSGPAVHHIEGLKKRTRSCMRKL